MNMDKDKEILRRLEIIEFALFGKSGTYWHETRSLSDGTLIGEMGSEVFVICPITKRPMSKGYHSITPTGNGRFRGELGAASEEFHVHQGLTRIAKEKA